MNLFRKHNSAFVSGFTLIELLVAVVVGIILLGGLVQIFVLTKDNYRIHQGLNYMQENLRFATGEVGYSARMAGFFYNIARPTTGVSTNLASVFGSVAGTGSVQSVNELTLLPGMAATPACGMISWVVGIQGFNAAATPPPCVDPANYLAGTDMVFFSYLRPVFLGLPQIRTPGTLPRVQAPTNVADADIFSNNLYAIVFDPSSKPDVNAKQGGLIGTGAMLTVPLRTASLFYRADEAEVIEKNGLVGPENTIKRGAAMMPLQVELYYVRPCAVLVSGSAICTAQADGGNPQPTLMRLNLGANGTVSQEPIVSGIEQFQLEYLASGCAGYLNATQLLAWTGCTGTFTAEQRWQRVINVRVAMIARSNERANEIDGAAYPLSADTPAYTAASATQLPLNNRYRRRPSVSFMQPRNATRPLPPVSP